MNNSLNMNNTDFFKVSQHKKLQEELVNTNNGFNGRVFLQQQLVLHQILNYIKMLIKLII